MAVLLPSKASACHASICLRLTVALGTSTMVDGANRTSPTHKVCGDTSLVENPFFGSFTGGRSGASEVSLLDDGRWWAAAGLDTCNRFACSPSGARLRQAEAWAPSSALRRPLSLSPTPDGARNAFAFRHGSMSHGCGW